MAFILQSEADRPHHAEMNGLHINGQDSLVQPLLSDLYQFTMCYAYWRAGVHNDPATFDLFFRRNPFEGEYTVFCGLEDCLRFVEKYRLTASDIKYLRETLPPTTDPAFFTYLETLDCSQLRVNAIPEGTVVFPRMPLISVEGPLAVCQLLETNLLNLVNYASLVATNAARFRNVAGPRSQLLEFGLRRAQGPNGGLTASKYCYVGGFDATSNVLAGKLFGIPVRGTQAHSFVSAFTDGRDLGENRHLRPTTGGEPMDLWAVANAKLDWLLSQQEWGVSRKEINNGELASFCAYAIAFPTNFVALLDTYDTLRSGLPNFCAVALALDDAGYKCRGCRLDSGDLAYLSKEIRRRFKEIAARDPKLAWVADLTIVASNDLNEVTIAALNEQQHEVNTFGVGTHLVTCQKQPALGCVYKLVELKSQPRIKISQEVKKITIPGRKKCYRLFGKDGKCILDLMMLHSEPEPELNVPILCHHPFEESKRAYVVPARVELLQLCYWSGNAIQQPLPTLQDVKQRVQMCISTLRHDHLRVLNPTPYKVSVSKTLYDFLHSIWLKNAPIGHLA